MPGSDQVITEAPGQDTPDPPGGPPERRGGWRRWWLPVLTVVGVAVMAGAVAAALSAHHASPTSTLATNPSLDPGTVVNRPAPNFRLIDERGHPITLRSFRGKVVILAFNDSQCTTICPLTTTAMVDAKRLLGPAAGHVQLLGLDANPDATSVHDVLSYSQAHGLLRQWHFLTGSLRQLGAVWKAYGIDVEIRHGQIDHTPALFMIDPQGRIRRIYLTQSSYSAIGQFGQLLAQEISHLLPEHPRVSAHYSYAQIKGVTPRQAMSLPRMGGGTVALGPGSPRLYLFFDTWDRQVTDLARQLDLLNGYSAEERHQPGLPRLTAVDEASVEPGPSALTGFLHRLGRPLSYPVGIDTTGRVADGYEVQDEPWLVLTAPNGRIAWYHDVSTSGWLTPAALESQVKAALTSAPHASAGSAASQQLSGSPPPLAALHRQASQLLGSSQALEARLKALHGYPVVINIWASWCGPCRAEFGLLANASARYGRQVAFLGADYTDISGDAQAFLRRHRVSYPSYPVSQGGVQSLLPGGVQGTPTTVFVSPTGKVVYVHTGQYLSQGTLDQDIQDHALSG